MSTLITQVGRPEENLIVLRVEGKLFREDAEILERTCADLRGGRPGSAIALDLADLTFFDSESGSVLRRVAERQGVQLYGLQISIQNTINLTGSGRAETPYGEGG